MDKENASKKNEVWTRQEAAHFIGVKPHTLAVWACNKRYGLPLVKIGRTVRYRRSDVEAFLQRHLA
jgi:excisionase family DNA binding protein